jgi:quercetin dioxygenase-like cupin family protein
LGNPLTDNQFGLVFSQTENLLAIPAANQQNFELKTMNKLIMSAAVVLVFTCFVFAVEEKKSKSSTKESSSAVSTAMHKILAPSELTWADAPPSLAPGAKMAVLEGDPSKKGPFTVRLQSPDGYKVPPHTHPTTERITVLSGSFHLGMGEKFDENAAHEMAPGSFAVLPAGMKHFGSATGETILQISSEGPFQINYVNPADDPRNTKK